MIEIVLNRFTANAAIAPATIQRTLGKAVYAAIPEDAASQIALIELEYLGVRLALESLKRGAVA